MIQKKVQKRFVFLVGLAFSTLLFSCNTSSMNWQKLAVTDLEGNVVDLSQHEGKRVFLHFWATWCLPCIKEMPAIAKAMAELEKEDWVFVFVSNEPVEHVKAFQNKMNFPFEYHILPHSIKLEGVLFIPQTYLINRKGEIVSAIEGEVNWADPAKLAELKDIP